MTITSPLLSHTSDERLSKTKLFIPVGIPGCGKSTFAAQLFASVVSTDAIRKSLTADENDQSRNDETYDIFHRKIEDNLEFCMNTFADATNLQRHARERLKEIADRNAATTHIILFRNNAQALRRNEQRERTVPPEAMSRMLRRYEQAIRDIPFEGHKSIIEIGAVY